MGNERTDQPIACAICGVPPGTRPRKRLSISRRFRAGPVPLWAIVHPGCDRRETDQQFRERMLRAAEAAENGDGAGVVARAGGARGINLAGPRESATAAAGAGVA